MSLVQAHKSFAMSAVTALIRLRLFENGNPGAGDNIANLLKAVDPSSASADFDSALSIHSALPKEISFIELHTDLRRMLSWLIAEHQPWWRRLFPYGRERLRAGLSDDEYQTFRSCGLFEASPDQAIVDWWDHHAATVRGETDVLLNQQGRYAEQLTLEYETNRLRDIGIPLDPIWVAIDDNGAGYDVRSYDLGPVNPVHRLIEVKSTSGEIPQMILTRNEWEKAAKSGDRYFFYVWTLPAKKLTIWSSETVGTVVPIDRDGGRWSEARIAIQPN